MQVFEPFQIAVLIDKTWPRMPDFLMLGGIAESQLQSSSLQVQRITHHGSQQAHGAMVQLHRVSPAAGAIAEPSSRLRSFSDWRPPASGVFMWAFSIFIFVS